MDRYEHAAALTTVTVDAVRAVVWNGAAVAEAAERLAAAVETDGNPRMALREVASTLLASVKHFAERTAPAAQPWPVCEGFVIVPGPEQMN